ncbi:MAG TPA: L,D-transpeptidase family protein [Phototrophicaceae bacterium]|nr:L,D-transpeptidase family protein [Phototrophicaceae bacterium]
MPPTRRSTNNPQVTQPVRVRPVSPAAQPTVPFQPVRRPLPPTASAVNRVSPPLPGRPAVGVLVGPRALPARPKPRRARSNWLIYGGIGVAALMVVSCGIVALGVGWIYAGGILPGVRVGNVALGGMSEKEAAAALQSNWQTLVVRDGERSWSFNPAQFGLTLDAPATAKSAYEQGRSQLGTVLTAIIGQVSVPPVVTVDFPAVEAALRQYASQFEQPPLNAGVRLVNGQVQPTPAESGRALDVAATLALLQRNTSAALAGGALELVMQIVPPSVTDASPMLEAARALLANPLDVRIFDPITGDSVYWSLPPEQWGTWLSAEPDANSATGLALTLNAAPVRDYLQMQADGVLDASRYLKLEDAVTALQAAVAAGQTTSAVRVYHHDRQHVVQSGETIISIAWDYGVPYPYVQQANGGLENVSIGQTITIPSEDNFLLFPVDPDKRIVVSITQQRAWVYENDALKWEWTVSTGINSSPTWPGLYQIIEHVENAYAANWNLWMPYFMGVYRPIPGSDFTNGFHGFPTRGGSQLLWTNSLGTRVTYGCILLSNENAQALYTWAEEGVVVEIQP